MILILAALIYRLKFEEHIHTDIDNAIKLFNEKKVVGEFTIVIKGKDKLEDVKFDEERFHQSLTFKPFLNVPEYFEEKSPPKV